jgi:hypothetical protein
MSDPDELPLDELGRWYVHVLWTWEAAEERDDPDATAAAYATPLTLPDGRVAALGDLTSADLAAARLRRRRPGGDPMTAYCRDCYAPLDRAPSPNGDARCPNCHTAAHASPAKARARRRAARRLAAGTLPLDEGGWPM